MRLCCKKYSVILEISSFNIIRRDSFFHIYKTYCVSGSKCCSQLYIIFFSWQSVKVSTLTGFQISYKPKKSFFINVLALIRLIGGGKWKLTKYRIDLCYEVIAFSQLDNLVAVSCSLNAVVINRNKDLLTALFLFFK